jgi:hypothetical protein
MKNIPYTYKLIFKPTNQYYYGVRWAKGCHPSDLFVSYFTSSKHIHKLIKEYGVDSFIIKVTKTFDNKTDAVNHEKAVLTRVNAAVNGKFINKANNMPDYSRKGLITIHNDLGMETYHDEKLPIPSGWVRGFTNKHRENFSKVRKGLPAKNKGKKIKPSGPCSETRKERISESRKLTPKLTCNHCGKQCDGGNLKRFHNDNCKLNPNISQDVLIKRSEHAKNSMLKQIENGNFFIKKTPKS